MKSYLIAGYGYVGKALAQHLQNLNHQVHVLTRHFEGNQNCDFLKITPIIADLNVPDTLKYLPKTDYVIICVAPHESTVEQYQKIYLEGVGNLLQALKTQNLFPIILYTSSIGVWPDQQGAWIDESTPVYPDNPKSQILLDAEQQILNSDFESIILRLAGIYGPGRNRIETLLNHTWPKPNEPDRYVNLIHLKDILRLILFLLENGTSNSIYIGVDHQPVLLSELYSYLTQKLNISKKISMDSTYSPQGKRCSNQKIKSVGFEFEIQNYLMGYKTILSRSF